MRRALLIVSLALAGTVAGQDACFVPNGTNRHDLSNIGGQLYKACENLGHSMCCNKWGDVCQPDGLCWNDEHKELWRESCTDPTWQSPSCVKLCISDDFSSNDGVPAGGMDMIVTKCTDGSYCCGNDRNATECCKSGRGVRIVNGEAVPASSFSTLLSTTVPTSTPSDAATSSPTSSANLSTAPSSTPPASTSDDSSGSSGSPAGAIGGGVGAGVGALVIGLAAWFFWNKRRKRTNVTEIQVTANEETKYSPAPQYTSYPSELPVNPQPVEMGSDTPSWRR